MNYRRRKSLLAFSVFAFACIGFSFAFQKNTHQIWGQRLVDSLSETQKREAQYALKGLVVHPELELRVFATEPMLHTVPPPRWSMWGTARRTSSNGAETLKWNDFSICETEVSRNGFDIEPPALFTTMSMAPK
jgi:hypothetical protein